MATVEDFEIGPVGAIYVGPAGDTSVLEQILAPTTQGGQFKYTVPEKWESGVDNSVQAAPPELIFSLRFYPVDPNVKNLANGLPMGTVDTYTPTTFALYSVLFLHVNEEIASSIYVPYCYTIKNYEKILSKTQDTSIPIQFFYKRRNRFIQAYYEDTPDNLATIMGVRSPI